MTNAQHTPTPFQITATNIPLTNAYTTNVNLAHGNQKIIAQVRGERYAAFIVKAVNNHDTLVNALQKIASGKISAEYLEDFCNGVLAAAEAHGQD